MRQAVVALPLLMPVFGLSVHLVRRKDFPLHFYSIHIKPVFVGNRAEPTVFGVVLPIGLRAAPFFSFLGNPIAHMKPGFQNRGEKDRGLPIGTDIKCRGGFERRQQAIDGAFKPSSVLCPFSCPEHVTVAVLGQVAGRVQDQQIDKPLGKSAQRICMGRIVPNLLLGTGWRSVSWRSALQCKPSSRQLASAVGNLWHRLKPKSEYRSRMHQASQSQAQRKPDGLRA